MLLEQFGRTDLQRRRAFRAVEGIAFLLGKLQGEVAKGALLGAEPFMLFPVGEKWLLWMKSIQLPVGWFDGLEV